MKTLQWDDPHAIAHVSWLGGWRGYSFPDHEHGNYWELVLVRRGVLQHRLEGAWQQHGVGWLTLLRTGESHALRGDEVEFVNLSMPQAIGQALLAPLRVTTRSLCVHLGEEQRLRLESDIESLAAAAGQAHERIILSQILATTARAVLEAGREMASQQPRWLSALLDRLAQADPTRTSLAQLRNWSGVSSEHLARSVRSHLDCTPNQLLRRRRLAAAARLLSSSERTVETIAARCGWSDLPLFHRQFRSFYGMTPGAFRARERRFIASPTTP